MIEFLTSSSSYWQGWMVAEKRRMKGRGVNLVCNSNRHDWEKKRRRRRRRRRRRGRRRRKKKEKIKLLGRNFFEKLVFTTDFKYFVENQKG